MRGGLKGRPVPRKKELQPVPLVLLRYAAGLSHPGRCVQARIRPRLLICGVVPLLVVEEAKVWLQARDERTVDLDPVPLEVASAHAHAAPEERHLDHFRGLDGRHSGKI